MIATEPPLNRRHAYFQKFHAQNPKIYEYFKRFSIELLNAGRTSLSATVVYERIRWETMIQTSDESFKLNNNCRPYYARLFMEEFPHLDGCFETRAVEGEEPDKEESDEEQDQASPESLV